MEQNFFQPFIGCLAEKAFSEENSRGRIKLDSDYPNLGLYSFYFLDKNKILQSKGYRRIMDKTQVFPDHYHNVHIRNRSIHTAEAVAHGILIADILGLNKDLVEAILLFHDIGHTPYGHLGEDVICKISGKKFKHSVMSVILAQKIERSGEGMNLLFETLEGGLYHSRECDDLSVASGLPLEYGVAMLADKIAYVFSDLNDALSCGYLSQKDLPEEFFSFGETQRERISNLIYSLVMESFEAKTLSFCKSELAINFQILRNWSYENFYYKLNKEESMVKLREKMNKVCLFMQGEAPLFNQNYLLSVALMTDNEINRIYNWLEKHSEDEKFNFKTLSYYEILKSFPDDHFVNIFDADLHPEDFHRWG